MRSSRSVISIAFPRITAVGLAFRAVLTGLFLSIVIPPNATALDCAYVVTVGHFLISTTGSVARFDALSALRSVKLPVLPYAGLILGSASLSTFLSIIFLRHLSPVDVLIIGLWMGLVSLIEIFVAQVSKDVLVNGLVGSLFALLIALLFSGSTALIT